MPSSDPERLQRLLGGDTLARLRRRLRRRYATEPEPADRFTLGNLSAPETTALADLLGRPRRAQASMQLSHAELDAALARAGVAPGLRAALERLDGPISDTRAAREQRRRQWAAMAALAGDARLAAVLAEARGLGLLKRLSGGDPGTARQYLRQADAVLARLPARGVSLARLAADTLGDAHALDRGQPAATLVRRALASRDPGQRSRELWAAQGVLVNELAKPVAVLNLGADGAGATARLVRTAAAAGDPLHLSLRLLTRAPPTWRPQQQVFVCENPAVLAAAADHLGPRCPPMVSLDGQLSAAPRTLLDQLAAHGAHFFYHGDFDWGGLRIANVVFARYAATAWRFAAADYRPTDGPLLQGQPATASWDADLATLMQAAGRAVHEESLLDALLADLAHRASIP
ncbi:MAG: TIGR02679 family protein [Ottowia sp.]|nr:TIGR02679 family protein [Ottowia sp.]